MLLATLIWTKVSWIAVRRRLFWINSKPGMSSIRSSTTAGIMWTTVVDQQLQVLIHPVGLCVDTDRQRLYWYDTEFRTISTSMYDGSDIILYSIASRSDTGPVTGIMNLEVYMVSSHTHTSPQCCCQGLTSRGQGQGLEVRGQGQGQGPELAVRGR